MLSLLAPLLRREQRDKAYTVHTAEKGNVDSLPPERGDFQSLYTYWYLRWTTTATVTLSCRC